MYRLIKVGDLACPLRLCQTDEMATAFVATLIEAEPLKFILLGIIPLLLAPPVSLFQKSLPPLKATFTASSCSASTIICR